jgi:pyridoxamine 5'-phosphate oxidase family protein
VADARVNPDVSLLADDVVGEGVSGARFLEIRGRADTVTLPAPPMDDVTAQIIRIHPRRVLSFNIDPAQPGFLARDIMPGD